MMIMIGGEIQDQLWPRYQGLPGRGGGEDEARPGEGGGDEGGGEDEDEGDPGWAESAQCGHQLAVRDPGGGAEGGRGRGLVSDWSRVIC